VKSKNPVRFEEAWDSFRKDVLYSFSNESELRNLRYAFYAGAIAFECGSAKEMALWSRELHEFLEKMAADEGMSHQSH